MAPVLTVAPQSVVVVDDHPIVLQGISDILLQSAEFTVAATALNGREAMAAVRAHQPDLVVLDLRLGNELAPDLVKAILEIRPKIKIVILTAFDDGTLLDVCLARGAAAVLLKDASTLDLVAALKDVVQGKTIVDRRLYSRSFRKHEQVRYEEGGFQRLSEREYEVLRLIARGLNTREIAAELSLMPNTVRSYTQTVLGKLQSKNRVMALATARQLRLI